MGQQLNANLLSDGGAAINAFGRMNQAFQIFCAVGVGSASAGYAIDSQGYLANGTYQITFTSTVKTSMTSTCGINTSSIPNNAVMTMTVETGGSNYDKKLTFDAFDQSYWVKNNSTVLRVATAENTSNGYSRTIAEYNKTTGVDRFRRTEPPNFMNRIHSRSSSLHKCSCTIRISRIIQNLL
jgi:hypothetical protein